MDTEPTDGRSLSDTTIEDFLDGLEEAVTLQDGEGWTTGLRYTGDAENAGTVEHRGETISTEEYERRLQSYREEHGPIDGIETIELNVIDAEADPFEQETHNPE